MKTFEPNFTDLAKKQVTKKVSKAVWPQIGPPFIDDYFIDQSESDNFTKREVKMKYVYALIEFGREIERAQKALILNVIDITKLRKGIDFTQATLVHKLFKIDDFSGPRKVDPDNPIKQSWVLT